LAECKSLRPFLLLSSSRKVALFEKIKRGRINSGKIAGRGLVYSAATATFCKQIAAGVLFHSRSLFGGFDVGLN
jgi:hypothetical protein